MENVFCAVGIMWHRLSGYSHNAPLCAVGRSLYTFIVCGQRSLIVHCLEM